MNTTPSTAHASSIPLSHHEEILVVPRAHLFPQGAWNGIRSTNVDEYSTLIRAHHQFHPRYLMETDPTYKQIIPYLVFTHDTLFFLMERHAKASEQRLKSKLTLGIGGHVRKEDMASASLIDWAFREFHEEVAYRGNLTITPLGIINDDSNEVGRVHLGFAFLLHGDSPDISIRSELQAGRLQSLQQCVAQRDRMETWSKYVLDALSR